MARTDRLMAQLMTGLVLFGAGGLAFAEVIDSSKQVSASGTVGTVTSLTVTPRTIVGNAVTGGFDFGTVSGSAAWKVAPQYLQIQHQSNQASWAIRILTNNRSLFPAMAGKITSDNGTPNNPDDDRLGYSGLVGSNTADPNNRVPLGWQAYKNPVSGGPATPTDADVGGTFNSPWAFLADASDCESNCLTASPVTVDKTIEFLRIAQGTPTQGFLLLHPNDGDRNADGDIACYLTGRFGGVPGDTYTSTIIVELYHE